MSNFKIETQTNTTKAAVIGNPKGFGQLLIKALVEKHLEVDYFFEPTHQGLQPLNQIKFYPLNAEDDQLYQNHYLFFVAKLTKHDLNLYKKIFSQLAGKSFRHTLIITDQANSETDSEIFSQFQQAQLQFTKSTRSNSRTVVLPYLYGPELEATNADPLNQAITQANNSKIVVNGNETEVIFPLHVDDALEGVLKATFKSSVQGKILYLGGHAITLLNLLYKIKHLLPDKDSTFNIEPGKSNLSDSTQLHELIQTSHKAIAFSPKTQLESGLKETIKNVPVFHRVIREVPSITTPVDPGEVVTPIQFKPVKPVEKIDHHPFETVVQTTIPEEAIPPTPVEPEPKPTQVAPLIKKQPRSFELPKKRFGDFLNYSKTTTKESVSPLPRPKKTKKQKFVNFLFLSLVLVCLGYLSWVGILIYGLKTNLQLANTAIASRDLDQLEPRLKKTLTYSRTLQTQIDIFQPGLILVLGSTNFNNYNNLLSLTQLLSKSGLMVIDSSSDIDLLANILTGKTSGDLTSQSQIVSKDLVNLYHQLSLANTKLDAIDSASLPQAGNLPELIGKLQTSLPQARTQLIKANELLTILPEIAGTADRKTYLILFQNNMEIRPTGGFIGSFGLLSFEGGVIRDLQVEDVYAADGQLQGYVEPPEPIARYLGEASWFLRDSNWDFNFPTSAETAAWFLEKQIGVQVDGVVGINLEFAQAVLGVMGEVKLPDFDDTINANNLYEKAQYQSEINFFPGSTQKKDYLGQIARILYNDLFSADKEKLLKFFQVVITQADENNLQFAFANTSVQEAITNLGWSGEVVQPNCPVSLEATSCLNDYLAVVDANLGVNKANLFLKRSVVDTVMISKVSLDHTLQINYKNNSTSNVWPGGIYRNYLRIYLPENTQVKKLQINGVEVSTDQITQTKEYNKTVVGTLVRVDPKATVNLTLEYSVPVNPDNGNKLVYQQYIQKQSGTTGDSYSFIYKPHPSLKLNRAIYGGQINQSLQTQALLTSDLVNLIEFMP